MRRHPAPRSLAAWFDGEDAVGVADHVAGCDRCRRQVRELRRVRAAVRGEPVPPAGPSPRWRTAAAPVAVTLVVVAVLVTAALPATVTAPLRAARELLDGRAGPDQAAGPATTATLGTGPASTVAGRAGPPPATVGSTRTPPAVTPPTGTPVLRLAVVVASAGPLAIDAAETVTAVRHVVDTANRAGGVAGRAVELVVVDAADARAVARLASSASVAVGGFGARPPVPWLFPADPYAAGSLAAEVSPADAGALLGADLARRGVRGSVAVVVADGPDAALADGIERAAPVARVAAPAASTCDAEIRTARRALPVALALAVPPDLAARCLDAAARVGWRPPAGVLVAPSAAYAGLERAPAAAGSRTVLGLPWPAGDEPGAARFRAAVPGLRSYRALVAYAAAELAVAGARARSPLRLDDLAHGTWQTDLVTLSGGVNSTPRVVVAGPGGWATATLAPEARE